MIPGNDASGAIAAFGIGSTNFRYVLGTEDGSLLTDINVEPTTPEDLESQVVDAVESLQRQSDRGVDADCISCAGLVNGNDAVIEEMDTPDGTAVYDIRVGDRVQAEFGVPTYIQNDCTASVLGEWFFGSGQGYTSIAHVTFGTGIGGGIVENGQLVCGEHGHAVEIGLIPVDPMSDVDSFDVRGAWEAFCSGRGIPRFVETLFEDETRDTVLEERQPLTAKDVFDAAADGDEVATDYLDKVDRYNAAGLGAIINSFNPGLITLGGGVVFNNPDRIIDGIEKYLDEYVFVQKPDIKVTTLADDIGLYGALGQYSYTPEEVLSTGQFPQAVMED